MVTVVNGKRIRRVNVSRKVALCPRCGAACKRHSKGKREIREVAVRSTLPVILEITYSKHYCSACRRHFSLPTDHFAQPYTRFSNRVVKTAVDLVEKQGLTLLKASEVMLENYKVLVPPTTINDWLSGTFRPHAHKKITKKKPTRRSVA